VHHGGDKRVGLLCRLGKPWERVVEVDDPEGRLGKGYHNHENDMGLGQRGVYSANGAPSRKTLGWQPGCDCDAGEPVLCTVLDPFSGSGTTGLVALKLERKYIGIELNPDYLKLSIRRIEMEARQEKLFK